jgi:phosphopentomutase
VSQINRVVIVVLDSAGVGALPDAAKFGDEGSNTLGHISRAVEGFTLPNLRWLGLGNIIDIKGVPPIEKSWGAYGKMAEKNQAKATTSGHWEMAGLILEKSFPTYPDGFPKEILDAFSKAIGRGVLANKKASGTVIIEEYGVEHIKTGKPIVYTSADSVFQIATHVEVVPVPELYRMCEVARELLTGDYSVERVIARPFTGKPGYLVRTEDRKDYSVIPPGETLLDRLKKNKYEVVGIGKIADIFAGRGLTKMIFSKGNMDGVNKLIAAMGDKKNKGLIFLNLVDFDSLYGHRNNTQGYADALGAFDARLPQIVANLREDDLLIITADHGCDPTFPGTDHTREYVPLLVYGQRTKAGVNLGTRETFADIGQTVTELFGLEPFKDGKSFRKEILG